MAIPPGRLLRDLRKEFQAIQTTMGALHTAVQVRPGNAEVIQPMSTPGTTANFECRPVVCRLPERAGAAIASIYVVFSGLLSLRTDSPAQLAVTESYSTNFAYFQTSDAGVTHAFGGHYDFAEGDIAHPRAHLQVRSQATMWTHAAQMFPSLAGMRIDRDPMVDILSRVRAPTAQMDFLSFMVQLAADHLVDGRSVRGIRTRFKTLTASCTPFASYEVHAAHGSWDCHRGPHWYPHD